MFVENISFFMYKYEQKPGIIKTLKIKLDNRIKSGKRGKMINNIARATAMILTVVGIVLFFAVVAPSTEKSTATYSHVNTVESDFVFQQLIKEHDVQGLVEENYGECLLD